MRNNIDDDLAALPSLPNGRIEPQLNTSAIDSSGLQDHPRSVKGRNSKAVGALSAVTLALLCSSTAFAWWSIQRMQVLEQQLIATQESFSKVSEDAAGRIQDITGQVNAAQHDVLSGSEQLKKRLDTLESSAVDIGKQQQSTATEHAAKLTQLSQKQATSADLNKRLERLVQAQKSALAQQADSLASLTPKMAEQNNTLIALQTELNQQTDKQQAQLQQLAAGIQDQQQQLGQIEPLSSHLKKLDTQLATLQKNASNTDELTRLQQDLFILRSEFDQRSAEKPKAPIAAPAPSLADFDAYRAQTHRTITALQEQLRQLQKNTP